jgi:sialidase-1
LIEISNLDRQIVVPASAAQPRNMGADLMVLSDGRWLLGYSRWLGGAHDDDGSQVCALISEDRGDSWSCPFDIARPADGVEAVRMPNFLRLNDGRLACFLRVRTNHLDTWTGMLICRDEAQLGTPQDGTELWSDPIRISPPAPGRHVLLNNRVVRLQHGAHAGRILLPLASPWPWEEEDRRGSDIRTWVLRSDDDGQNWRPSDSMLEGPKRGLMEPYIVEMLDGRLRMWMRTQVGRQYESISTDGGVTWSTATVGPLVSPESPVAVARHEASGLLMVVWNHNEPGAHTADRTPICIAFSQDEGETWFDELRLDPGDGEPKEGRSFSYPGAHFLGDTGFVTYYENAEKQLSLIQQRFELSVT